MWFLNVMIFCLLFVSVIALAILLPAFIELSKDKKQLEKQIDNLFSMRES